MTAILGLAAGTAAALPPELPRTSPPRAERKLPKAVFPVLGPVRYFDDFGAPRAQGPHQANDIMAPRRALALAVERGTVEFDSGGWGCMLNLYGASGTKYVYIHLNNDLTKGNDNRGRCVPGVAFARGLKSGQRVEIGQHIAYVGNSGDADGIHPHLHFERHPGGGAAVNPFRWLNRLPRLLFAAPPGTQISLTLRGTVAGVSPPNTLRLRLQDVKPWPSGPRVAHKRRLLTVAVPATATFETTKGFMASPNLGGLTKGSPIAVWTTPAASTLRVHLGRSLVADRVQLLPAGQK